MKILIFVALTATCTLFTRLHGLPFGCQRARDNVVCNNLREFPRPLISDAKTLTIGQSKFDEIPSDAFVGLPRLTNLTLYLLTVKTIRSCAFSSMHNLKYFDLMFSDIGIIESYAFTNITGKSGSKMSLFMLNIVDIHPYAFKNIDGFDRLSFDLTRISSISSYAFQTIDSNFTVSRTNITTLDPGAFQDLRQSVSISTLTIQNLGCHTFDALYEDLQEHFKLFYIMLRCTCDLAWFVRAVNETPAIVGDGVVCFRASDDHTISITALTEQQLCPAGSPPSTCEIGGVAPPTETDVCETSRSSFIHLTSVVFVLRAVIVIHIVLCTTSI